MVESHPFLALPLPCTRFPKMSLSETWVCAGDVPFSSPRPFLHVPSLVCGGTSPGAGKSSGTSEGAIPEFWAGNPMETKHESLGKKYCRKRDLILSRQRLLLSPPPPTIHPPLHFRIIIQKYMVVTWVHINTYMRVGKGSEFPPRPGKV